MEKIKAVLAILNNYIVISAFYVLAVALLGAEDIHWGSLCFFAVIPFVFYFIRRKCHKFLIFLCMHVLTMGLWCVYMRFWGHRLSEVILYLIVLIFYMIFSFYLKGKTDDGIEYIIHPAIMIGMLVVGFWGLNKIGNTGFNSTMIIMLVIQVGFFFAHHYIDNYISFVKVNQISVNRFHGKKLFRLGTTLVGGYIVFSAAILMLFTNPQIGNIIATGLKKILLTILKFVLSLIRGEKVESESAVEEAVNNSVVPMEIEEAAKEPGLLARIFDVLLEVLLLVVFVAAIVAVLVWIIRIVQGIFKTKKKSVVIEGEASIQDITERLEKEESGKKKSSIFYGLSFNARIRKAYYKYVMSNKKKIEERTNQSVLNSTAREMIANTAEYYEKARYSHEECTSAELKDIKKGLSKTHQ